MRILNPEYKKRSRPQGTLQAKSDDEVIDAVLNGRKFRTSIGKKEAMEIPAVAASVDFISKAIASLPVKLYRREGESSTEVVDDYRLKLLNSETGDLLDPSQCKRALVADMLLDGAGYSYLPKRRNKILSWNYVPSEFVNVVINTDHIFKEAQIRIDAKVRRDFDVMRWTMNSKNGITGEGIIERNALLLATMYNAMKFENSNVSSGTKRGYLQAERRLDDKSLAELKQGWRRMYSTDANDNNDILVLNQGISFKEAASTATEQQLNESKDRNSILVYSIFGLPRNLFDVNTANTDVFANACKVAILPIVEIINTAINKFFLLETEKDTLFFKLDTSELMKASIEARFDGYKTGLSSGFLQVDDVRRMENLPPLGLEFIKLGLADVLYNPKTKEVYVPNTNESFDLDDIKKSKGKEVEKDESSISE